MILPAYATLCRFMMYNPKDDVYYTFNFLGRNTYARHRSVLQSVLGF